MARKGISVIQSFLVFAVGVFPKRLFVLAFRVLVGK